MLSATLSAKQEPLDAKGYLMRGGGNEENQQGDALEPAEPLPAALRAGHIVEATAKSR